MKRMTVSLDEFFEYLIKKWKMIIIGVLIFIVLFVLSAVALGEEIVIPPSEKYLDLKEQESSISSYIENAPLMQMDSTCVQEIIIYLSDISDREALKDHFDSGSIWGGFEYEYYLYYIMDLATWIDGSAAQSAEIVVQHYDEEQCRFMAEFLQEKLSQFDESMKILVGEQHITRDELIAETQSWYENRLNAIEGQLEYAAAGYVIEASIPVAAVTGLLTGGLVSIVVLFAGFLLRKKSE